MIKDTKAKRVDKIDRQTKKDSCYYKMQQSPVDKSALNCFKRPAFATIKHE